MSETDQIPIFGYGTLILPTSLISRFEKIEGRSIMDIYKKDIQYRDEKLLRNEALKKWEKYKENITILPAKLYGFKRYYSKEVENIQNCVLEAVETNSSNDWMNGVIIHGLTSEQKASITETEKGYTNKTIKNPTIENYIDEKKLKDMNLDIPSKIEIYLKDVEAENIKAKNPKNKTCHDRILTGIDMLGDIYDKDLVKKFKKDFKKSTYEISYNSKKNDFNTVLENELIRKD